MKEMNQAEINAVSGGIIGVVVAIAAAALLGGCATMNGPNNGNLRKDDNKK